ncbi:MAG: hypothetical protein ABI180_07560 [Microcoleus sp.]
MAASFTWPLNLAVKLNTCASARVVYKVICYRQFVAGKLFTPQATATKLRSAFVLTELLNIGDRTSLN